jgi:hypothetical protein
MKQFTYMRNSDISTHSRTVFLLYRGTVFKTISGLSENSSLYARVSCSPGMGRNVAVAHVSKLLHFILFFSL